jgi:hypothetical protein
MHYFNLKHFKILISTFMTTFTFQSSFLKTGLFSLILLVKTTSHAQNEGVILKIGGATNAVVNSIGKSLLIYGGSLAVEAPLKKRSALCFHLDVTGELGEKDNLLSLGAQLRSYSKTATHGFYWGPDATIHGLKYYDERYGLASINLAMGYQADLSKKIVLNIGSSAGLMSAFKNFNPVATWRLELQFGIRTYLDKMTPLPLKQ